MADLRSAWAVLETEAALANAMKTAETGHQVGSAEVEVGADAAGSRYLLIPLVPGEAVLEDRSGRWVRLARTTIEGRSYVALSCGSPRLAHLFHLLAEDILGKIDGMPSAAAVAFQALQRWKELFEVASGPLGDSQLIGLLAELICLERCYALNPAFDLATWAGPTAGKHDFQAGLIGVEVKATVTREGRIIGIHGIEQLDPSPGDDLYLAYHRFEPVPEGMGDTLPGLVDRLEGAGAPRGDLLDAMGRLGYSEDDAEAYLGRCFKVVDQRVYNTTEQGFPRLTPGSFEGGALPAGLLRVRYSIDLTNEPPSPLDPAASDRVWAQVAGAADGAA